VAATTDVDLNQVSAFVRVMKAGSFTAAARALGLPKSSVSRRVSALEQALRVRLLQRGTRKLVLTEAGRLYFEQAQTALGRLADANAAVIDMSQEVAGPIRFTAGGDNTGFIANLLAEFLGRYPKVQIEAVLTPRRVDLVGEGFDLALRAGALVDSSLIVRRLGRRDLALFASRNYLRRAGRPRSVRELSGHRFVLCGEPPQRHELRLTGPAGVESLKIDGPLVTHEFGFAADAITAGIGIGLIPEAYFAFMAKRGLSPAGRALVRLLPDHGIPGTDLSLVSPPTAYEPARVGLLRGFLAERIQPLLGRDPGSAVATLQAPAALRRPGRRENDGHRQSRGA
jgi:DNA-binding transcriptional LysR family regulator